MQQHGLPHPERRSEPREPKAFALWLRLLPSGRRVSAWMLDVSAGGAALLTAAETAPAIGQQVELAEMHTRDRLVRDDAGPLPPRARVLRHDDTTGVTRRVALRFESEDPAAPTEPRPTPMVAISRAAPKAPPLPPVLAEDELSRMVRRRG